MFLFFFREVCQCGEFLNLISTHNVYENNPYCAICRKRIAMKNQSWHCGLGHSGYDVCLNCVMKNNGVNVICI